MLDPDEKMLVDVHPLMWREEAGDWFPDEDRGWSACFDRPGVRPTEVIAFRKVSSGTA
jgi:hypothetical protein